MQSIPQSLSERKPGATVVVMVTKDSLFVDGQAVGTIAALVADPAPVYAPLKAALMAQNSLLLNGAAQADIARRYIAALDASHAFAAPIATRVDPLSVFYPAEGYHQDYLVRHPDSGYIETFDLPKLDALRRLFPALYTPTPTQTAPNSSAS